MNNTNSYTLERARLLKIQSRHLAEWKELLLPDVYTDLEKWAIAKNSTGYSPDIRRGVDLSNFVANYLSHHVGKTTSNRVVVDIPQVYVNDIKKAYPDATNKQIGEFIGYILEEQSNSDNFFVSHFIEEKYSESDERLIEIFGK